MSDLETQFTVLAEFEVKDGKIDTFLAMAYEDASQSLANEPGCHQFDVLRPVEESNHVVLHEVYTDRSAFEDHTRMPHFAPFQDGTAPLLAADPLVRFFVSAIKF